jgi:SAM-dependent methyltransferase
VPAVGLGSRVVGGNRNISGRGRRLQMGSGDPRKYYLARDPRPETETRDPSPRQACYDPRMSTVSSAAFDPLARGYDTDFTDTPVGRALRDIVWSHAVRLFQPGQRILELGCGTGEDATRFARAGISVLGTDVSAEMVEVAQRKARQRKCVERTTFRCVAMEDIGTSLVRERFHGAFSNFGAINCVGNVPALAADLAELLVAGAPLMWVVMGRHVPWEWLWFGARGQLRKATRRLHRRGIEWRGVTVRYPSPGQLTAMLAPYFKITRVSPLGCVLPPTYAARWLNRSPRILTRLSRLEVAAQRRPALARIADHYILEARRV